MKKCFMLGFALMMSVAMMAQNESRPDMGKMSQHRAEQLSKTLELKGEAKAQFETMYVQYATELMGERTEHQGRHEGEEQADGKKGKKKEQLTEAQATERLQQMIERQEKQIADQQRRLEVQKKYIAEFGKTLTPQQVWQVMQPMQRNGQRMGMPGGQRMGGGPRMGGGMGGNHGGFGGPQGGFGGGDF